MKTVLTFSFIALLSLCGHSVYACTCDVIPLPRVALKESEAVFVGKVTDIDSLKTKENNTTDFDVQVKLEVSRIWKGVEKAEVTIITKWSEAGCGFQFKQGQTYLVYAYLGEGGKLRTGYCTRTAHIKDARRDLRVLGSGRTPEPIKIY